MEEDTGSAKKERRFGTEAVALLLLVPLAIVFGGILFNQDESQPDQVSEIVVNDPAPTNPVGRVAGINGGDSWQEGEANSSVTPLQAVALEIWADGQRDYRQVLVMEDDTVADVLARAEGMGLRVVTQDYGRPLGVFVEALNGIANDPGAEKYWTLYVNGKRSLTGASSVKVAPGDRIDWRFEQVSEE